jgi:hypothetical protein
MQPRTLKQIIAEIDPVYRSQVSTIRSQQKALPGQIRAEEAGLQAKQTQAFGDILGGARQRGLGFSGIPLGEQAKYTATEYLPALARLRQSGKEQATSLEQAILGIRERQQGAALGQRQYEQQRYDAFQSEQRQIAEQRRREAAARAAAGGGGSSFAPTLGSLGLGVDAPAPSPIKQAAYNDVFTRVQNYSPAQLISDYNATKVSAGYGNEKDKQKLIFYAQLLPSLFGKKGTARNSQPQRTLSVGVARPTQRIVF